VTDRLVNLLDFFEQMSGWYEQMRRMPTPTLLKFVKMGERVRKLLGV
jgi:hypothetical protein